MTRVWLPDPPEVLGGLPDVMVADVWTGGEPFPASEDEVEVIVLPQRVRRETLAKVARLKSLKLVQLTSAGAERVIPYIPDHITLCNARGAHDAATAEWTVGAIVAHLRNFPRFSNAQAEGRWDFTLSDLAGMKDGALLVNAARGAIVDTDALLKELNAHRIKAALDVTDPEPLPVGHPLWTAPGLLLTPHVGGAVTQVRERAYAVVRAQLARYAAGEPLHNVIGARGY